MSVFDSPREWRDIRPDGTILRTWRQLAGELVWFYDEFRYEGDWDRQYQGDGGEWVTVGGERDGGSWWVQPYVP